MKQTHQIAWDDVEKALPAMTPVDGGFSQAHRGLVMLPGGVQIFVKLGTDDLSKDWAKKEIAVYRFLKTHAYATIPELLGASPDKTAFALEPLTTGWDWSENWTAERLDATLEAMDVLAEMQPKAEAWMTMGQLALDASRDGWVALVQLPEQQAVLANKLQAAGQTELAETLDIAAQSKRSSQFVFRTDTLVHYDVRADNCAWNPATKQVKLVDWNWTQLGDPRVDTSAMLVHVQRAGFDISRHTKRLDADALQWLAGFWFKAAATPIWPGGPEHLRDFQLQAGITAYTLAGKL